MLKAIATATLILALSCLTYAGEMQTGLTGTTNTAQGDMQNGIMQTGAQGNIQNGLTGTSSQTSIDGLDVTFNLMQSLLGLF